MSDGSIAGFPPFREWLPKAIPKIGRKAARWDWAWHRFLRQKLRDVTLGKTNRLALAIPPQHGKTSILTVGYVLWRMLRTPGLRAGICCHTQTYAEKNVAKIRKLARELGIKFGTTNRQNEFELENGSTLIARGAGAAIIGESLDLCVIDDPHGGRKQAGSVVEQESVYEWYMDDVTPRIQDGGGALIIVHTRWGPGDLIGRILESDEAPEWIYVVFKAIAEENDPLGRQPGEALCPERYSIKALLQLRQSLGIGFESQYQQNPIPRGGTFFQRDWFPIVDRIPEGKHIRGIRYYDLAASRHDSACYTAGLRIYKVQMSAELTEYYIDDMVRGKWSPADRNQVMLDTAKSDSSVRGFERTWFEKPVFDKEGAATRAIVAKLSGYTCSAHNVSGAGSKELRAEPLADAAKAGLVKLVAGPWVAAFLTELEGFPKTTYRDQVDSASGGFTVLSRGVQTLSLNGERF